MLLSGTCILENNTAADSAGAVSMKGGVFRNEGELRIARNMAFGNTGGGAFGVYEGGQIEIQNAQLLRNMAATTNDYGSGGDVYSHVSQHAMLIDWASISLLETSTGRWEHGQLR